MFHGLIEFATHAADFGVQSNLRKAETPAVQYYMLLRNYAKGCSHLEGVKPPQLYTRLHELMMTTASGD